MKRMVREPQERQDPSECQASRRGFITKAVAGIVAIPLSVISRAHVLQNAVPKDLHYSKDHIWIKVVDGTGTIGVTDWAQNALGDVVYVELPKVDETFKANESFGSVESVKAVSELMMPVSATVIKVNGELQDQPEQINKDPYGKGWMIQLRLKNKGEIRSLMTAVAYEKFLRSKEQ